MPDDRETSEDFFSMDATFVGEMITLTVGGDHDGGFQAYGHGEDEVLQEDETILGKHYGFSSYPPAGTELILQPLESGADASLAEIPETRPTLASGESKMWDDTGNLIHMFNVGIKLAADGALPVYTQSPTKLGSFAASDAIVKGTTQLAAMTAWFTAVNTFLAGWNGALTTLINTPPADAEVMTYAQTIQPLVQALQTAVSAVQATLATWLSIKHAVDV
jgi:phage gp45-like